MPRVKQYANEYYSTWYWTMKTTGILHCSLLKRSKIITYSLLSNRSRCLPGSSWQQCKQRSMQKCKKKFQKNRCVVKIQRLTMAAGRPQSPLRRRNCVNFVNIRFDDLPPCHRGTVVGRPTCGSAMELGRYVAKSSLSEGRIDGNGVRK